MGKSLNVLMVDDHPMVIEVYKDALAEVKKRINNLSFKISEARSCEEALYQLTRAREYALKFDLVFLDICLPPHKKSNIKNGEDLGGKVKSYFPSSKLIISTPLLKNYRLNNILQNLNPEAFLIKTDASFNDISSAIQNVIEDHPYYSKTIMKLLRNQLLSNIVIDKIDRLLLSELAAGTKMKDLPKIIPMSLAGIERRKRLLKNSFNINKKDDKTLIEAAKKNGFI